MFSKLDFKGKPDADIVYYIGKALYSYSIPNKTMKNYNNLIQFQFTIRKVGVLFFAK
jgi:hypothetical protein